MIYQLRTLECPTKGIFRPFDRTHFCQSASNGEPFNSRHILESIDHTQWIGQIFKDFTDDDWQCQLTGESKIRGAWSDFDTALAELWQWYLEEARSTLEWRILHGLQPIALPSGTTQRQGDRVLIVPATEVRSIECVQLGFAGL